MLNHRVLVVDDGDTNRKLIQLVLGRAGAQVEAAENGLQAVTRATTESFDLILMDMQMPIMDGYAATAELRARGLTIPIIALTANAMKWDEAALLGGRLLRISFEADRSRSVARHGCRGFRFQCDVTIFVGGPKVTRGSTPGPTPHRVFAELARQVGLDSADRRSRLPRRCRPFRGALAGKTPDHAPATGGR